MAIETGIILVAIAAKDVLLGAGAFFLAKSKKFHGKVEQFKELIKKKTDRGAGAFLLAKSKQFQSKVQKFKELIFKKKTDPKPVVSKPRVRLNKASLKHRRTKSPLKIPAKGSRPRSIVGTKPKSEVLAGGHHNPIQEPLTKECVQAAG